MERDTRSSKYKKTGDLAFAAYALLKGLKVIKAEEWKGRANEYEFLFEDPPTEEHPDGIWDNLFFEYAGSEAAAYDASVRNLKKLCKRNTKRN